MLHNGVALMDTDIVVDAKRQAAYVVSLVTILVLQGRMTLSGYKN